MGGAPELVTRERDMAKVWAAFLILTAMLFAAPVIESATSGSQVFQAIGTADGGGGG